MKGLSGRRKFCLIEAAAIAILVFFIAGTAQAYRFETGTDWDVNLDNSIQYTIGWRAQSMDQEIANHPFYAMGDYKFPDTGDVVTNRIQDIIELQGVYQNRMGFRVSGSLWKDFGYDDEVKTNPADFIPGIPYSAFISYPSGIYSSNTSKYHVQGGELLDAFVFWNTSICDTPVYVKAGRVTQFWGNAFFFGFSNIAYSQHPVDFIKAFSQPGSEVKELFLPRTQLLIATDLSPELSIAAQYFFEFRPNRFPEGGTYLGPFDILYEGPQGSGALVFYGVNPVVNNPNEPAESHGNFGVKVSWAPEWAKGDLGFYFRRFDEVQPWTALLDSTGAMRMDYATGVKLYGLSYERSFGLISTAFEVSYRQDTGLQTTPLSNQGGTTGDIVNVIANTMIQLGTTPLWQTGIFIGELTYTHLVSLGDNEALYNGVGHPACAGLNWRDGCATDDSIAFAMLFDPQWLQVFPGVDFDLPISLTYGINGNPAYTAGPFYAQGTKIYSFGIKALFYSKHSIALQYNGYSWRTADSALTPAGQPYYSGNNGFGGNGPIGLSDKGWIQLTFKTSF